MPTLDWLNRAQAFTTAAVYLGRVKCICIDPPYNTQELRRT
ncbi:hypothetical protein [Polaromonas naphthalenivorans]|nr:hypothetical protein [Polaromonas naphthalenivorans]